MDTPVVPTEILFQEDAVTIVRTISPNGVKLANIIITMCMSSFSLRYPDFVAFMDAIVEFNDTDAMKAMRQVVNTEKQIQAQTLLNSPVIPSLN